MSDSPRKKSPRAPSVSLDEALERALKAYEKERLHAAPTDVVAQNLGYKSANNGAALATIASLRYFGLLERPKDGFLAVVKDVETFKFAPDEARRRTVLMAFLKSPPLYAELLNKYQSGLPSDANLRFELIQRGFIPQAAEIAALAFKRSVEFTRYYDVADRDISSLPESFDYPIEKSEQLPSVVPTEAERQTFPQSSYQLNPLDEQVDRIPVRLPKGRRAWLLIPSPFFVADKDRLKAQIDLLLTEDEETQAKWQK